MPQVPPRLLSPTPQRAVVVVTPLKPRWPQIVTAIVVVAALVATGVYALTSLLGSEQAGGTRTPEEAIARFVRDANAADLLGVLDILVPSEREAWIDPLKQMFVDGRRLRVLPGTADIDALRGADLQLTTPTGAAEMVAPDAAAAEVRGSVASALTFGGFNPVGMTARTVAFRVVAVRDEARWYISVWHSLAENLRTHSLRQLSWPSTQSAVTLGSTTPIEAVSRMLSAVEALSLKDLISLLDPVDAAVLQRVAPWFLDGTQQALDELVRRSGLTLRLSDPQFVATTKGNNSTVTFSGLQIVAKSNNVNVSIRDNCGIFTSYGEADTRECLGDAEGTRDALEQQLVRLGVAPIVLRGILVYDDVRGALDGLKGVGVAVHNVGGQWYIDPTGTVVRLMLGMLSNGTPDEAQSLADDLRILASLFGGGPVGGAGTQPDVTGSRPGQAGQPGTVDEYGRYTECLAEPTFDDARSCMEEGILNGRFPRTMVDGSFLASECGWRGNRFDPSIARLSGDAYVRLVRAAAACMKVRISSGFLIASQMPFELVRSECLKGVNPSRMNATQAKEYFNCQLAG